MKVSEIKDRLESMVNDLFFEIQTQENIDNGEISFEDSFAMDEELEALAKRIRKVLDYEKELMEEDDEKDGEEIEEEYCESSDTTFLVKYTYEDGELKSREVISFYSGEPNGKDTEYYSTKGIGTKCEYTL